ncbi:MAG: multifunctional CCA addition/repair protein [Oligoflexia bacterium]|nr:multifunctional CCA addition/repair protein [Oligoflexia bacterium]MBF0367094.1 multifunctional CCA addition/repair protein [Oligoflexia bacterium]
MEVYKVGGSVRDLLLGIPSKDNDYVVVGATSEEMLALGYLPVGKDFPVFLHPKTKEEYALARKEFKRGYGYKGFAFDVSNISLEDDLLRRDLTINAMAIDSQGKLIDPYHGQEDLKNKILRHVSPFFKEDPLRVLRVARFAAKLKFTVHEETLQLMSLIAKEGELQHLTAERVLLELTKALQTETPSLFFEILKNCNALEIVFPEIDRLIGVSQNPKYHPEGDAYKHTLLVLDSACRLSEQLSVRFASLVHDFGKALTPKAELPHHRLHDVRGISVVQLFCRRLKICNEWETLALKVVEFHLLAHHILELKAKNVVSLLISLNAIRNPQMLQNFILCCQADDLGKLRDRGDRAYLPASFLSLALEEIRLLNIAPLIKQYKGALLGEKIREARIQSIRQMKKIFLSPRGEEILRHKHQLLYSKTR